jgi:hypothetical protein
LVVLRCGVSLIGDARVYSALRLCQPESGIYLVVTSYPAVLSVRLLIITPLLIFVIGLFHTFFANLFGKPFYLPMIPSGISPSVPVFLYELSESLSVFVHDI